MSRHTVFSRLSLAVSLLALVVALSGAAVAAGLAANSVGAKQLKKGAVTTAKIKKNAVKSASIKDGAVTGAKIADGSVTGSEIADGSVEKADLAPGVLTGAPADPAAPVTIRHDVPAGTSLPAVTVGGLRFTPSCSTQAGDKVARFVVQSAAPPANAVSISGVSVVTEGATKTPSSPFGTGASSFEPSAIATSGAAALTTFEGVIRSGAGPWVRVSIGLKSNLAQTNCELQAVISVLG